MSTPVSDWEKPFSELFTRSVEKYRQGHSNAQGLVDDKGRELLKSIGATEQEFFDFVEDFAKGGEPDPETARRIAAVRREYFLKEQQSAASARTISMADLPSKEAKLEGIEWLPRLIAKAEAKLKGEMPPDLMYGCGGDRRFFKAWHIDPAEFLHRVWEVRGNQAEIVAWLKKQAK